MHKRIITILTIICVLLSLVACGKTTEKETTDKAKDTIVAEEREAKRTLIFKAKNGRLFLKEAKDLEFGSLLKYRTNW